MRSTLILSGFEKRPWARMGQVKRLLYLACGRGEIEVDLESGVWLRSFQLLDLEHHHQDPVQEWGEEVEDGVVYGVTLHREPVQPTSEQPDTQSAFNFAQYKTLKVRRLKAATLDRLVTELVSPECNEADYGRIFLSTYRAFTSTNTLIELLFQREDMITNPDNTVCLRSMLPPLIRMWLEDYSEDLRDGPQYQSLRLLYVHLRHRLCFRRLASHAENLLKKFQEEDRQSCSTDNNVAAEACGASEEDVTRDVCMESQVIEEQDSFMTFPVREIAEQLTRLDADLFVKVVPFHCLGCVWSQRDKKENRCLAPTVRATIAQFNAVTNRVITSLLCAPSTAPPSSPTGSSTNPTHRARIIEKWIAVAQECRQLRNFSSLRAILSALQSNAVYRLKRTWAAVSRESIAVFDHLCETFPDENCVLTNREILVEDGNQPASRTPPLPPRSPKRAPLASPDPLNVFSFAQNTNSGVVPYLGTYLTVLTMLDTALTDTVEGGLINFEKRRREFEILSQIRQLQASCAKYTFSSHSHISTWLNSGGLLSDQESYELSRELEPPVDPCPSSPSSWSRRLLTKKLSTKLLLGGDNSTKKTHCDQISVSSSGSSSSEIEDLSSPSNSPNGVKLKSLSRSCQNISDDFDTTSSSVSPTLSTSSCSSSQQDLCALSPDCTSPPPLLSPSASLSPSSSSSSLNQQLPVYNKQVADSCIVRVSVEFGNNGNIYKSILLTSQDKTAQVVQRALEKHNLEEMSCQDFTLTQVLSQDKELLIPDKANVFYAMCTTANYDFVLRQRWRCHGKALGSSSSPVAAARGRHAK
ncbi:ral guanine nucleotide dissociation stimulator-like 1 [Chanos chanos]|uniref:Ral guanine nucleotide dissociation stimulator-like 1 n=1 Tax=Chanos chanos TaxID=29144 RepID=A0A6J2W2B0_CHACN|nr:ral guanine nucleotide dissociation stimulator-like 1 [Chanos chanos]